MTDNVYFAGLDNCVRRLVDGNVEKVVGLCCNYSNEGSDDGTVFDADLIFLEGFTLTAEQELMVTDANILPYSSALLFFNCKPTSAGVNPGYYDGS